MNMEKFKSSSQNNPSGDQPIFLESTNTKDQFSHTISFVWGAFVGGLLVLILCFLLGVNGLLIGFSKKLDLDKVFLKDGQVVEGLVEQETESGIILNSDGESFEIDFSEILSIEYDYLSKYLNKVV